MRLMTGETSACRHNACGLCTIPQKNLRRYADAAWVVDVAIDRLRLSGNLITATEVNAVARELADDSRVPDLQGNIIGAIVLGLSGECTSKQQELEDLMKEQEG